MPPFASLVVAGALTIAATAHGAGTVVVMAQAEHAGATLIKPGQATFCGGCAGYFRTPTATCERPPGIRGSIPAGRSFQPVLGFQSLPLISTR